MGQDVEKEKDAPQVMMSFLQTMYSRGTPVQFIICDIAGENKELQNQCKQSKDLMDIKFEFTPRGSPEFNGKVERKFGIITGRMRVNYVSVN